MIVLVEVHDISMVVLAVGFEVLSEDVLMGSSEVFPLLYGEVVSNVGFVRHVVRRHLEDI